MRIIKPKQLVTGDVIGLIAPASNIDTSTVLEKGVRYFEKLGYRIELGKNVDKYYGYLAGSDQERADDLHTMFRNKNIKAIICIRGGYGAFRLLDKIDYKLIRNNPKIFVGYSEITALQMAILKRAGLVTFAGPMVYPDFSDEVNPFTEEFFWRTLTSTKKIGKVSLPESDKLPAIVKGKSSGRIIGGNLAVLSAMIGTNFLPDFSKRILFVEDIGEAPYKIDRILNKMRLANIFRKINGIILGRFVDCFEHDPAKKTLTLGEVIDDYFKDFKIPILYTFPHGHIKEKVTIPFGIEIKMNASKGFVEFAESGVK
jgi:muramoyltetrapeptide carboxypeptidase